MRCDECKFWDRSNLEVWEGVELGFGACKGVRERWEIQDEASPKRAGEYALVRQTALKAARAYVEDGSEYHAVLITAPDFFCALHEPRL